MRFDHKKLPRDITLSVLLAIISCVLLSHFYLDPHLNQRQQLQHELLNTSSLKPPVIFKPCCQLKDIAALMPQAVISASKPSLWHITMQLSYEDIQYFLHSQQHWPCDLATQSLAISTTPNAPLELKLQGTTLC